MSTLLMLLGGSGRKIEDKMLEQPEHFAGSGILLSYYDLRKGLTTRNRMNFVLGKEKECKSKGKNS